MIAQEPKILANIVSSEQQRPTYELFKGSSHIYNQITPFKSISISDAIKRELSILISGLIAGCKKVGFFNSEDSYQALKNYQAYHKNTDECRLLIDFYNLVQNANFSDEKISIRVSNLLHDLLNYDENIHSGHEERMVLFDPTSLEYSQILEKNQTFSEQNPKLKIMSLLINLFTDFRKVVPSIGNTIQSEQNVDLQHKKSETPEKENEIFVIMDKISKDYNLIMEVIGSIPNALLHYYMVSDVVKLYDDTHQTLRYLIESVYHENMAKVKQIFEKDRNDLNNSFVNKWDQLITQEIQLKITSDLIHFQQFIDHKLNDQNKENNEEFFSFSQEVVDFC